MRRITFSQLLIDLAANPEDILGDAVLWTVGPGDVEKEPEKVIVLLFDSTDEPPAEPFVGLDIHGVCVSETDDEHKEIFEIFAPTLPMELWRPIRNALTGHRGSWRTGGAILNHAVEGIKASDGKFQIGELNVEGTNTPWFILTKSGPMMCEGTDWRRMHWGEPVNEPSAA